MAMKLRSTGIPASRPFQVMVSRIKGERSSRRRRHSPIPFIASSRGTAAPCASSGVRSKKPPYQASGGLPAVM